MICGHGSVRFDSGRGWARCLICGAQAPGQYTVDSEGAVTGFRVDAWRSEAWFDTTPVIFRQPRADA